MSKSDRQYVLASDWHGSVESPGVDSSLPGIYLWTIDGAGIYVGKYKRITRPRLEYARNVERLLNDLPYRKNKRDGFRKIHHALAAAVRDGRKVTLTILENPQVEHISARERELILEIGTLNG